MEMSISLGSMPGRSALTVMESPVSETSRAGSQPSRASSAVGSSPKNRSKSLSISSLRDMRPLKEALGTRLLSGIAVHLLLTLKGSPPLLISRRDRLLSGR